MFRVRTDVQVTRRIAYKVAKNNLCKNVDLRNPRRESITLCNAAGSMPIAVFNKSFLLRVKQRVSNGLHVRLSDGRSRGSFRCNVK